MMSIIGLSVVLLCVLTQYNICFIYVILWGASEFITSQLITEGAELYLIASLLLYVLCGGWISSSSSGAPRICHAAMLCVESIYIYMYNTHRGQMKVYAAYIYIVRALRIYCCRYAFLAQFAMLSYPFDVHITHLPL